MATRGLGAPEWGKGAQQLGEKTFSFCCARLFLLFCWTVRKAQVHATNTGTFPLEGKFFSPAKISVDVM